MVLRRRCDVMLDFFVDNRVVGIVGPGHDVFVENGRADRNEKGNDENRHGQAGEVLTA